MGSDSNLAALLPAYPAPCLWELDRTQAEQLKPWIWRNFLAPCHLRLSTSTKTSNAAMAAPTTTSCLLPQGFLGASDWTVHTP